MTSINDYERILGSYHPVIDVRAAVEFDKGSFGGAVNMPLMTDEERHLVGIAYKEQGHDQALLLGHQLVGGEVKDARVKAWVDFVQKNPEALVMCFRGGLRSRITQEWLSHGLGRPIDRIEGGYKALRNYALSVLDNPFDTLSGEKMRLFMIGGHTGAGKTPLLHRINQAIDLEGLAKHRGSAFGPMLTPQPAQATFENLLVQEILRQKLQGSTALFFENESRAIGRVMIPLDFMTHLSAAPLIVLTSPVEDRVMRTWQEYVVLAQEEYNLAFGEELGKVKWHSDLSERFLRIQKRLGLERYNLVSASFEDAYKNDCLECHQDWVRQLLTTYYDPMYAYQRGRWEKSILFEGDAEGVLEFIGQEIVRLT